MKAYHLVDVWYEETVQYHHPSGPRDSPTKWSKSDRERQISYDITYM